MATMTEAEIDEFLEAPRHAIVATNRVKGPAQLSPVWYLYEEGRMYIGILVPSAKHRNLRRDPSISVCVDGGHPDARAVMILGTAEMIEEESSWRDEIETRITRRYLVTDEEIRRFNEEYGDSKSALLVITPERTISQDLN